MNHKISLHGVILMSGILSFAVLVHKSNGILTDSNKLDCTDIQCPVNCPKDSYLQAADNNFEEIDEDDDYEEDLITPEPYIQEIGNFEELPPEVKVYETNSQHSIKERQKREVFFQDDIDRCCGDQICVCHKSCLDVPKCLAEEVAIEVIEGQGIPGHCCSAYKCVKKETCHTNVKQSWWKNKCIKCSCFGENEICEQLCAEEEVIQNCFSEYWQKPMMNGVSWKEGGCTSCTCEQGERSCLTPVCPKLECEKTITLEDECCAKCVVEEKKEELKTPTMETTTSKELLFNKTTGLVTANEESSTVSQLESTTDDKNLTTLMNKAHATELDHILGNATTQTTLISVVDTTTTTPISIGEFSSTVSSIDSGTKDNEYSTSTVAELILVNDPETTTETTFNDNKTLTSIEDSSSIATVNMEESVKSSTSSSISQTATSSPLTEATTSSIHSSTNIAYTTDTTVTATLEDGLSKLRNEIATNEISSSEALSSTMPTLTNTAETEDITTVVDVVKSTTENLLSDITEETITEESTTNSPAQKVATSTATTSSAIDSSTASELPEPTTQLSLTTSTSASTILVFVTGSTTPEKISSTNVPKTINISSTNNPINTTPKTTTTSTTSSPYSSTIFSTTSAAAPHTEEDLTSSTTSAPEPIESFFQSFGDSATVDTQQQMRGMFDKIDYVVMIVLFIGALLCIALGLIIRHTKNRKKMYSSIPNSETSLSQTSTNTMMTV